MNADDELDDEDEEAEQTHSDGPGINHDPETEEDTASGGAADPPD